MPTNRSIFNLRAPAVVPALVLTGTIFLLASSLGAQSTEGPQIPPTPASRPAPPATTSSPAHSKKLVLKDGSILLAREYHVEGDRMRYYDLDGSQWEEMPAALVDWDATKKLEADKEKREAAILEKAHVREEARRAEAIDIDASLEAAPGVFLPPGAGFFVFDGKAVVPLTQAQASSKVSKGKMVEKILVKIPVPERHTISLPGKRATMRISNTQPEFYMRTADEREPQMKLIRAKVQGDSRHLENLDELFGGQQEKANTVPIQLWQVAQGVYRFTMGQDLKPGEYAFAENIPAEARMSLYVWDFGVDASAKPAKVK